MKEHNDLFEKFSKLGLDDKRNTYSEELIKISFILKTYLNKFGQDIIADPYNYKKGADKDLSESELLDIGYKDIYNIKTALMLLLSLYDEK